MHVSQFPQPAWLCGVLFFHYHKVSFRKEAGTLRPPLPHEKSPISRPAYRMFYWPGVFPFFSGSSPPYLRQAQGSEGPAGGCVEQPVCSSKRQVSLEKAFFPSGTFSWESKPIPDGGQSSARTGKAGREPWGSGVAWTFEPAFEGLLLAVTWAGLCHSLITEHLLRARSPSSLVSSGPQRLHLTKEVNIPALQGLSRCLCPRSKSL